MANAKIVVRISLGYKELSKPEESNNTRRINANHTELIPIDLHKLIKNQMANTVCCIHVSGDEKQHIRKRTPSSPISFYDCNERKNFFLRSKTIDHMKTNTKNWGRFIAKSKGNIQCTVYLLRCCFSVGERNWPTNKKLPFPSNYLMRSEHLWEESQTIYFRLPQNIIKHFIFVHLFRGRWVA